MVRPVKKLPSRSSRTHKSSGYQGRFAFFGANFFSLSRSRATRKGRYLSRSVGRRLLSPLLLTFMCLGLPLSWWLGYPQHFFDQSRQHFISFLSQSGFYVKEIFVEGRQHTNQQEILKALGTTRGQPIFKQDLETLKRNLEKIDWVKNAHIQRCLPHHLYIKITERQPIALWQHQKNFFLVDQEGVIIQNIQVEPFRRLPLVVGADAPIHAPKILNLLEKFPKIREQLSSLTRIRQRRWDLTLNNSILVKLPADKLEDSLARLSILIEQKKISPEDVSVVDLRNSQQIVLRLSAAAAVRIKAKGKEA